MKIPEFIEWLKTQDQSLTVQVLREGVDFGFDGENECSSSYVSKETFYECFASVDKKNGTILLGEKW